MKLAKRQAVLALVLLFLAIIGILWVITTDNVSWPNICTIIIAELSVAAVFFQWLLPVSPETVPTNSSDIKTNNDQSIIVDPFQRQNLEKRRIQTALQKAEERRKRKRKMLLSLCSIIVVVFSVPIFIFLQLLPQLNFNINDNDYGSRVTSLAWSPDNTLVASTTQDGSVRIWDIARGLTPPIYRGQNQNTMYNSSTKAYNTISWAPNGAYLAFGNNDNKIRVVEVSNLQVRKLTYLYARSTDSVNTVEWSPDGQYLVFGGEDGIAYIKKLSTDQTIFTYSNQAPISALAWSQNGKLIASGGSDGEIHVWNATTGKDIFSTPQYSGVVTSLAWSPTDPSLLASASSDSQIDIWDLSKGYNENPIVSHTEQAGSVNSVAWSPNGK